MNDDQRLLDKINEQGAILLDIRIRQERIESRLDLLDIAGVQKRMADLEAFHNRTEGSIVFIKAAVGVLAALTTVGGGVVALLTNWN